MLIPAAWAAESEPTRAQPMGKAIPTRPDPEGVPTRVSLTFLFIDVTEINDLKQEFTADIFLRLQWHDPRLRLPADASSRAERVLPLAEVWQPQVGSFNRRDVDLALPDVVTVDPDGLVTYSQRVFGSFAARMDLHSFPRDTQTLAVEIISYRYSPDEVEFQVEPQSGLMQELSLTGWHVELGESEMAPLVIEGAKRDVAAATFSLAATRDVSYYVLTMGVPLILIALMAWAIFWIDPSLLPPQVGISTAAVFSLIAFRFSLKLSLPRISYLTNADWFVLAVTVLVFSAFGHVIVVGRLAKTDREVLALKFDRWGRWIYLTLLLGLALTALR